MFGIDILISIYIHIPTYFVILIALVFNITLSVEEGSLFVHPPATLMKVMTKTILSYFASHVMCYFGLKRFPTFLKSYSLVCSMCNIFIDKKKTVCIKILDPIFFGFVES